MSSPAPILLTFNIPYDNALTYVTLTFNGTVTVHWGDGTISEFSSASYQNTTEHRYSLLGIYHVEIYAPTATTITGMGDYYSSYPFNYLQSVDSWGGIEITSLRCAFSGIGGNTLNYIANIPPTVTSFWGIFSWSQIPQSLNISNWDVSNVQDMGFMFFATNFNPDISGWKTTSLTSLFGTFVYSSGFNRDLSGWDTSKVTNMYQTFYRAYAFNQNLSNWSIKSIQNYYNFDQLFSGSAMNGENISNTLYGWSRQSVIPIRINIYLQSNVFYWTSNGLTAYNILTNAPYYWNIQSNGQIPNIGSSPVITSVTPSTKSLIVAFTQANQGIPAPTYYYSFNGTDICGNGVTSSPIIIPDLTLSQYYTFYIIASNASGNTVSSSAAGKPLVIGSEPLINSVTPSANSLIVSFAQLQLPNPLPTYFYSFDGVTTSGNGVSYSPITIPNLTLSQIYTFYVISSNGVGNIASLSASGEPLVAGSAPVINRVDPSTNSLIVSFSQSNQGNPLPTYYYSFNGIDSSGQGVASSPITIPNLTLSQTYVFYIISSNQVGNVSSASASGTPNVIGSAPIIDRVDSSTNSLIVSFSQSTRGNPAPTYYYSFNGVDPSGQGALSSPIKIPNLTLLQTYTFYIIASNAIGNVVSVSSSGKPFLIGSAPVVTNVVPQFNSLVAYFNESVGGNPAPRYYYSFNGSTRLGTGTLSSPITIPNLTLPQNYVFYIIASNDAGNVVSVSASGGPLIIGSAPAITNVVQQLNSLVVYFNGSVGGYPPRIFILLMERTLLDKVYHPLQ